jgi:hypothetical protein
MRGCLAAATGAAVSSVKAGGARFLSTDIRIGSDLSSAETLDAFLDLCGGTDAAHCGSRRAARARPAPSTQRCWPACKAIRGPRS